MDTEEKSLEEIYHELLKKYAADVRAKFSQMEQDAVPLSTIKEIHLKELSAMSTSVFNEVSDGEILLPADPFMNAMFGEFNRLLKLKQKDPIAKLFAQRRSIEEQTRRMRFWSENEMINQPNEVILNFIAKYQIYRGVVFAWDNENAFRSWQQSRIDECREFIYDMYLTQFL